MRKIVLTILAFLMLVLSASACPELDGQTYTLNEVGTLQPAG